MNVQTVIPFRRSRSRSELCYGYNTSCGLWRYIIGDTISFTSINPYKFKITGRTKSFINAFGEELIIDNAEKGLGLMLVRQQMQR